MELRLEFRFVQYADKSPPYTIRICYNHANKNTGIGSMSSSSYSQSMMSGIPKPGNTNRQQSGSCSRSPSPGGPQAGRRQVQQDTSTPVNLSIQQQYNQQLDSTNSITNQNFFYADLIKSHPKVPFETKRATRVAFTCKKAMYRWVIDMMYQIQAQVMADIQLEIRQIENKYYSNIDKVQQVRGGGSGSGFSNTNAVLTSDTETNSMIDAKTNSACVALEIFKTIVIKNGLQLMLEDYQNGWTRESLVPNFEEELLENLRTYRKF